jgi:hypothetical protein
VRTRGLAVDATGKRPSGGLRGGCSVRTTSPAIGMISLAAFSFPLPTAAVHTGGPPPRGLVSWLRGLRGRCSARTTFPTTKLAHLQLATAAFHGASSNNKQQRRSKNLAVVIAEVVS